MAEQKAARETPAAEPSSLSRRRFLRTAGIAAGGVGLMGTLPSFGQSVRLTQGDAAVLRFLAAAELLEDDLWQQYAELAVNNPGFNEALRSIDPSLIRYIQDDRDDERSHANLINAFLMSAGLDPVNLDAFRTLPGSKAKGSEQRGRLTNLTNLTVDTSWFNRYRGTGNPDFGDRFAQLVEIAKRPTIPVSDAPGKDELQTIAHSAAFHFAAIEQGGGSLYNSLLSRVSNPEVVAILASIGPTEVYHFAVFHKSLEGIYAHNSGDGLVFPDLRSNRDLAEAIFPEPCRFLREGFPLCSVIRPRSPENAGALAAATGLVRSGLLEGQSQAFFDAVVGLAQAADAARRI